MTKLVDISKNEVLTNNSDFTFLDIIKFLKKFRENNYFLSLLFFL